MDPRKGERHGRLRRRLPCADDDDKIATVDIVQQRTRPFVKEIGIKPLRPEEFDPALPPFPLGLSRGKLGSEFGDPLIEVLAGLEPAVARVGVNAEIADHDRGYEVQA